MDRYLIWELVKPSHLLVYVALLGILLHRRRLGRWLLVAVSAGIIAAAMIPIGAWLTAPLELRFTRPDDGATPDGIVVLAGAESASLTSDYTDPHLHDSGDRLTVFLILAYRFPEARLVHAGAGPRVDQFDVNQSDVARAVIVGSGVDENRVVFEDQSTNTCNAPQQIDAAVARQPGEKWWLVTSAFHMPRAVACFRAAGWDVVPYPVDYRYTKSLGFWRPELAMNLMQIDLATHEWLGLVYYRLSGQIDELFPAP